MSATTTTSKSTMSDDAGRRRVFAVLTGLAALAILLQGLWAGSSSSTTVTGTTRRTG
jgi:hypothetical protein